MYYRLVFKRIRSRFLIKVLVSVFFVFLFEIFATTIHRVS